MVYKDREKILIKMKTRIHLINLIIPILFMSCSEIPNEVTPNQVQNTSEGIMTYKGKPYSGKVIRDNNGYLIVKDGIITHLIITYDNGTTAIDIELSNQHMLFKDESGRQIYKDDFFRKYPSFKNMSDAWDEVYQIN